MQFLLIAHDGTDAAAPARRQKVREEHLAAMRRLKSTGNCVTGGAILNDQGDMIGSAIIYDFPDRAALNACIKNDPYVIGKVWQQIEIKPFRVAKPKID